MPDPIVRLALRVPFALYRLDDRRFQFDLLLSDAHEKHGHADKQEDHPEV